MALVKVKRTVAQNVDRTHIVLASGSQYRKKWSLKIEKFKRSLLAKGIGTHSGSCGCFSRSWRRCRWQRSSASPSRAAPPTTRPPTPDDGSPRERVARLDDVPEGQSVMGSNLAHYYLLDLGTRRFFGSIEEGVRIVTKPFPTEILQLSPLAQVVRFQSRWHK